MTSRVFFALALAALVSLTGETSASTAARVSQTDLLAAPPAQASVPHHGARSQLALEVEELLAVATEADAQVALLASRSSRNHHRRRRHRRHDGGGNGGGNGNGDGTGGGDGGPRDPGGSEQPDDSEGDSNNDESEDDLSPDAVDEAITDETLGETLDEPLTEEDVDAVMSEEGPNDQAIVDMFPPDSVPDEPLPGLGGGEWEPDDDDGYPDLDHIIDDMMDSFIEQVLGAEEEQDFLPSDPGSFTPYEPWSPDDDDGPDFSLAP